MPRIRRFAALTLCAQLVCTTSAGADVITDWNAFAVPIINAGRPGSPAGIIDFAIVQAAVHDAIQAYDKRYRAYAVTLTGVGSPIAAVATAARDVLAARFGAATIEGTYQTYLASKGLTDSDPGVSVGRAAADAVLALRVGDGAFPAPGTFPAFIGGTGPGEWRPTLPANAPMAAPWLGDVRPFMIEGQASYQPAPLPALTSAEYTEAYNEVKAFGSLTNSSRSPQQAYLARFYSDNFITLWYRNLRTIATTHLSNPGDSARLLALASMASADALICSWAAKTDFNFWRPITAIREAHTDGNPGTARDEGWLPLVATPPYPDYTSGANSLTGVMTRILALVIGTDHVMFRMRSESPTFQANDAREIEYTKFSDVAKDVVDVRILQGIHFRFADTEARSVARRVADFGYKNFLEPVED